ncbi:hypothetical protein SLA2020_410440 [Shorea laevis]
MATTRLFLLLALCVIPMLASAKPGPFQIRGKVYCDTCRAGFETVKSYYISAAKVKIECKDRNSLEVMYSAETDTDSTGTYNFEVQEDHGDQMCYADLVSSPVADCKVPNKGRHRATVILTSTNGAVNNLHYANNMGFLQKKALDGCDELIRKLLLDDEQ